MKHIQWLWLGKKPVGSELKKYNYKFDQFGEAVRLLAEEETSRLLESGELKSNQVLGQSAVLQTLCLQASPRLRRIYQTLSRNDP